MLGFVLFIFLKKSFLCRSCDILLYNEDTKMSSKVIFLSSMLSVSMRALLLMLTAYNPLCGQVEFYWES